VPRISRLIARRLVTVALPLLFAVPATGVAAQSVLGLGDDATVLPRGALRADLSNLWTRYEEEYDASGAATPFGSRMSFDPLTAEQIESQQTAQTALRTLTNDPTFTLAIGAAQVHLGGRSTVTPLVVSYGVTNRLMIGVNVPLVRNLIDVDPRLNPTGPSGSVNMGPNPAFTNPTDSAATVSLVASLAAASTGLQSAITGCQANPSSRPDCAAVLATGPALATRTDAFAAGVSLVYLNGQLVPLTGSTADQQVQTQLTALQQSLQLFGFSAAGTSPAAAVHPMLTPDYQRLVTDSVFGVRADSLTSFERLGLGDVELFSKVQWLNTVGVPDGRPAPGGFRMRSALSALVRLPTGKVGSPSNILDPGTGTGEVGLEIGSQSDFLIGRRFWSSVVVHYTHQFSDSPFRRITDPEHPYPAPYTLFQVNRQLGTALDAELTPRVALGRYFVVGAQYLFHHKAADRYSGTFDAANLAGQNVTLDASVLGIETAQTTHRVSIGVAFSTLQAYHAGQSHWPLELSYQHIFSVAGSGGTVPVASQDLIRLRFYVGVHADKRTK
jgi:hypothetical protein